MNPANTSTRHRSRWRNTLVTAVAVCVGAALLAVGAATPATAQAPASAVPRLRALSLSADTIAIGDRFQLSLVATIPADMVAFLPDSLEGSGFEPFDVVQWSATEGPEGDATLTISYPLIAFDVGEIVVPDFGVYAADRDESQAAGLSSPGDVVGSWERFRESPAAVPSARVLTVPEHRVWVASVLVADETGGQLTPRPAADVSGASRHWPSTLLAAVFGLALIAFLGVAAKRTYADAREREVAQRRLPDARSRALLALDELLASEAHLDGRTKHFFTESSTIVRAYIEELDARWSRAWTSTELMRELTAGATTNGRGARVLESPHGVRELAKAEAVAKAVVEVEAEGEAVAEGEADGPAAPRTEELVSEMIRAEVVKFGGARPDAATAETHWRVVRDWIAR